MMPVMTHQSPAPMPMLLASGVEPALTSTVPRPMANPSMLSRNWTAMIRTTPPKMADQEMRRWIWEPPMTSVVVVSTDAGDLEDGELKVLADIHPPAGNRVDVHPGGVAIKISEARTQHGRAWTARRTCRFLSVPRMAALLRGDRAGHGFHATRDN